MKELLQTGLVGCGLVAGVARLSALDQVAVLILALVYAVAFAFSCKKPRPCPCDLYTTLDSGSQVLILKAVPRTYRRLFSHQELQRILGERVLVAHRCEPDEREYDITIMPVPGVEKPEEYQMRVEVTEKPNARPPSDSAGG